MHLSLRILLAPLVVLDWVVAVAWLLRVLVWRIRLNHVPDLTKQGAETPPPVLSGLGVRLSVIVPARNEAAKIAATLRSLLDSSGVDLEILAVDDRSSDETGAIMDRMAALHDGARRAGAPAATLRVLHITAL